jgi:branched-chain amino acid transport system ATP-binding protein
MSDPSAALLDAREVSVHFGGLRAVTDVSVAVAEREIVAVVGPNGAGKTTLLNAISGLVPMSGEVRLAGSAVRPNPRMLARAGLARSFQSPQLIEQENAVENVVLGAHLRARYSPLDQVTRRWRVVARERDLAEEARELLGQAELSDTEILRPVVQLTHGMRKRIDIARALMSRPRILLMDEPTAGMGTEERSIVEQMALRIRADLGTSILMVEHHMDVVRAIADRVVAMQTGAVLKAGPVSEVLESEEFVVASLGRAAAETLNLAEHGSEPTGER